MNKLTNNYKCSNDNNSYMNNITKNCKTTTN